MKKVTWLIVLVVAAAVILSGSVGSLAEQIPMPERIQLHFFYDEACGSCDGTADLIALFDEHAGDVKDLYPYDFFMHNVFGTGREYLTSMAAKYGVSTENLSYPVLFVNGKLFSGEEAIAGNLKEAFLTAGEDIFEYKYVYYPANDAEKPLFVRNKADRDNSTLVYFYRTTCDECNKVKPIVDALPAAVTADGRETGLDVIRFNSRSGNNSERVTAFFKAYGVPEDKQMVPIVFLRDTYLAGYDEISANLTASLERGDGLDFQFPE